MPSTVEQVHHMATHDGQPDGLEFRDRTETLLERAMDKYDHATSGHSSSLLDRPGISVHSDTDDKPDVAPPAGDILPTIAEEHGGADDLEDGGTDEPPEPATVHVADSPEPATP